MSQWPFHFEVMSTHWMITDCPDQSLDLSDPSLQGSRMIQVMLLKSLLQVSGGYHHVWWATLKRVVQPRWRSCPVLMGLLLCLPSISGPGPGDHGLSDHQHADGSAHLLPGPAAGLHPFGRCWDPPTGPGDPAQSHRSPWQLAQV